MANINFESSEFENCDYTEYLELCRKGQILVAVKKYKERTGCSLKEAKDYIDTLRVENGLMKPSTNSGTGCIVVLCGAIIIITTTFFFL